MAQSHPILCNSASPSWKLNFQQTVGEYIPIAASSLEQVSSPCLSLTVVIKGEGTAHLSGLCAPLELAKSWLRGQTIVLPVHTLFYLLQGWLGKSWINYLPGSGTLHTLGICLEWICIWLWSNWSGHITLYKWIHWNIHKTLYHWQLLLICVKVANYIYYVQEI